MSPSVKQATLVVLAGLTAAALAGCTPGTQSAASPDETLVLSATGTPVAPPIVTADPTATPVANAEDDPLKAAAQKIGCDDFLPVGDYLMNEKWIPRPDMGAREFASGTVTFGADGGVETYTVAAGDAGEAIGERLCVDWVTLLGENDKFSPQTIQPGDVLIINP